MGKQQDIGESDQHGGSDTAHRDIGGSVDARLALAQHPATTQTTLYELASDASPVVRKAVATRTDAPAQALRPLTRDHDRDVREAVARNPSTSVGNLLRLVRDADRWVRWAVAGNPGCDESVRRAMAEAQDKELRGLLAESRELEPDLAAMLINDVSPEVRERLAIHTHDPDVITALLADRTARVRKGVARNTRTSVEQRGVLARDSVVDVRATLVRSLELDEDDLHRLVDDRAVQVRLSMATSTLVPPHIRQALEDDPDESVAAAARDFGRTPRKTATVRTPRVGARRPTTAPTRHRETPR
ncbi:hypothetical protein OG792_10475 [Micromonospora sp. NBC_01699]|uniref:hypothetical protein n=1 Tax=Micromonospora sp. NBC_01699 TaxID=2975984 RepID=UPI002E2EF53B|nr:hypothetical protein [Micromonospora sp. NBC_01699]